MVPFAIWFAPPLAIREADIIKLLAVIFFFVIPSIMKLFAQEGKKQTPLPRPDRPRVRPPQATPPVAGQPAPVDPNRTRLEAEIRTFADKFKPPPAAAPKLPSGRKGRGDGPQGASDVKRPPPRREVQPKAPAVRRTNDKRSAGTPSGVESHVAQVFSHQVGALGVRKASSDDRSKSGDDKSGAGNWGGAVQAAEERRDLENQFRSVIRELLSSPQGLQQAFILNEILKPPPGLDESP